MTSTHALSPGTVLDRKYKILSCIGQGGFGITYKAEQTYLRHPVVIKELFLNHYCTRKANAAAVEVHSISLQEYSHFKEKFLDEARTLLSLKDQPHIVQITDFFEENGTAYLVMPLIEGEDLETYLRRQPDKCIPEAEAMNYIGQLCQALSAAHSRNILHRDLKPANVLLTPSGQVYLIDFGAARQFIAEGITQTMTAILTPGYAPIEQYSERVARGAYTDVYALAAVLYRMLTGKVPPPATDRALGYETQPVTALNRLISQSLSDSIMKGLAFRYQERYQNVKEFWDAVKGKTTSVQSPPVKPLSELDKVLAEIDSNMVFIKGGTFKMGSDDEDAYQSEQPVHTVRLDSFSLSKFQVTQRQWEAVMGNNPSHFKGKEFPVEQVSWDDVQAFIQKLNQLTGKSYRLPTEAEWEYAAKAGQHTKYSGSDSLDEVGWYNMNSGSKTHPVGQKKPNAWGIYDMSGNVWEWCQDEWDDDYNGASGNGSAWVDNNVSYRVIRGGSWFNGARNCRASYRGSYSPTNRYDGIGFRLSRTE